MRGNMKSQVVKPKSDEPFGPVARLEIANLVHKLLPICQKRGLGLQEVCVYLSDKLGGKKAKTQAAHERTQRWIKDIDRLQLGKGSRHSLRKRGSRGLAHRFVTPKGLKGFRGWRQGLL